MFTEIFSGMNLLNAGIVGFESSNVQRNLNGGQYINHVSNNWVMVIIALGLCAAVFTGIKFISKIRDNKDRELTNDVDKAVREVQRSNEKLLRDIENARISASRLEDRASHEEFIQSSDIARLAKERKLAKISNRDPKPEFDRPKHKNRNK